MRILANENFPGPVVRALRAHGFDVAWIREDLPGTDDKMVLSRAQAENRILVTFDKGFGELAVRFGLAGGCGVVLFRLSGPSPDVDNARTVAVLQNSHEGAGHFAVVHDDRIRFRRLSQRKRDDE